VTGVCAQISVEERRGAHIDYIKSYACEYLKAKEENRLEEFRLDHSMYDQLVKSE
jgi:hypothetical protein